MKKLNVLLDLLRVKGLRNAGYVALLFMTLLTISACDMKTQGDKSEDNGVQKTDATFTFFDVGQGDSSLVVGPTGETILIDTGRHDDERILELLEKERVETIDMLVLTHPHSDHIGQADKIIKKYNPKEIWMSGNVHTSQVFERVIDAVLESDAEYHEPVVGETHEVGAFILDVVSPSTLTGDLNNDSIAFNLTYGEITTLFTGDVEKEAEQAMVNSGKLKHVDILKVGHHGSSTSSHDFFLSKVSPTIAIYSAETGNSYGHPHAEALARLNSANAEVFGTDVHGTIKVITNGIDYEITMDQKGDPTSGEDVGGDKEPGQVADPEPIPKSTPVSSNCIDINAASEEEVMKIQHIGPERAAELAASRPYQSVSELNKIKGIGPARIADITSQGLACVN